MSNGFWPCPFKGFHCCPDGVARSKGIPRLMTHTKRHHFGSDDRKDTLRRANAEDPNLLTSVCEAFRLSEQWLCWECMCLHSFRRECHHEDRVVRFVPTEVGEVGFIVGAPRPCVASEVSPSGEVCVDVALLDRVFSLPIKTVKSIPFSCRMAFAQALTTALGNVVAMPDAVDAWIRLLLLPRCTLRVFTPVSRQDKRSGNRKNGQCLSIQRALSQWGDREGFGILIQSLFTQPVKEGLEGFKKMSNKKSEDGSSNVNQCLRKVADGHFTAAVKVLCSFGFAPLDKKTMKALVDKHPCMPLPTMPAFLPSEPHLVAETDSVLGCIKSFPKGTSCGRDGLRAQHLLDALCGEGSVIAVSLLRAISVVVNLFLWGGCPRSLAEFVASAPLTPLLKPDNGIRPIAVGSIWRRVVYKVAMKGVGKDMAKYFGDFHFGVGIPNGAEAVLHSANRLLNTHHQDGSLAMLTVNFSNAFNLVDRTALLNEVRKMCPSISAWVDFLYGQPARLYVGNDNIWSSTGVQQGDPLGPLLFAIVLHPLVL
ncbi:putative reverse transcriptase domain-containing protein [Helianthus annuus]|nr:putative reverse transcriptase domain-containing protein [Helianthus annuus]